MTTTTERRLRLVRDLEETISDLHLEANMKTIEDWASKGSDRAHIFTNCRTDPKKPVLLLLVERTGRKTYHVRRHWGRDRADAAAQAAQRIVSDS